MFQAFQLAHQQSEQTLQTLIKKHKKQSVNEPHEPKQGFYYAVPIIVIGGIGGAMWLSFEQGYSSEITSLISKGKYHDPNEYNIGST